MYTIEQLQACDFLLKKITSDRQCTKLFQKNLKLVVEIDSSYWFGDFVDFDGRRISQQSFDDQGDPVIKQYSSTGSETLQSLKGIWEAYASFVKPQSADPFWNNPLIWVDSIPLLFNTLTKILDIANLKDSESPLFPYLFNAKNLDKGIELPFINLAERKINLISIIEVTNN
ncbi:hypothetical protein GCM10010912_17760 [Paenibacillus albidus]|uniref:Uncharacterized protein n=1 Tax=Paenibacillus albidus TaxID=2041023 RepID=A0A917C6S4_9BACL|nr:hypothetical protein [Paenibacillus albidus]GGF72987.1 hypothetical protein GCM10010912_17760 [Paenibacillus albidus]